MAAPTGSIFNTHAKRVEEVLGKNIEVFMPGLSRFWTDVMASNVGVASTDQLGRDFMVMKTYTGGVTGVIEPGGPGSDFALYGDPSNTALGAKLFTQGLSRVFPDASQGMNQASYRLGIPLRSMVTNIMLTLGEMQAEATKAFIGQVIAPKMQGFGQHMAQVICNYFFISQNTYYSLTSLAGSSGTGWDKTANTNATLWVDTTYSNYAVDRFMVGMRVQFYDATGATLRQTTSLGANTVFVVTALDELTGKIYFKPINGASDVNTASFANTDICVLANSKGTSATPFSSSPYFTGIAGINSWMKFGDASGDTDSDANCLLGGERVGTNYGFSGNINVNTHPEFKSFTVSAGGQPLTEHFLRKVLRRYHMAKGKYGHYIDCLLAPDGVWMAYEAQKIGRQFYDRTGKLSNMNNEGSTEGFTFEFDGRSYTGYTDSYVESNTVYGLRKKGNWKRYSPPDPSGVRRNEHAPAWAPFKFVGGALTGTGSNQIPIQQIVNGRTFLTEGVQLPGYLRMQVVPDQVTGIKITSVAEDRIYA